MHDDRRRPRTGTTPVGVAPTYIVVDPVLESTTVQVIANGTVTFTVDFTDQNIMYDAAAQAAVNVGGYGNPNARYVVPASAVWTNLIASGAVSAKANIGNDELVFAIRINITAGAAGSVTYTINQG